MKRNFFIIIMVTIGALLLNSAVWAGEFTVNSAENLPRKAVAPSCLCIADNNLCTLRAAVETIKTCATDNTITVAGETFQGDIINVPYNAYPIGNKTLTISGNAYIKYFDVFPVPIVGDKTGRIFVIESGKKVIIDGLKIMNGYSADNGGGIYIQSTADLKLLNTIVDGNQAKNGAGIYNIGSLTLRNSVISNNIGLTGGEGGGIYNGTGGVLNILGSTIDANKSDYGGGIYNSRVLTVENSTISNNEAIVQFGGGVEHGGTTMIITNSTISGNRSKSNGGGIWSCGTGAVIKHATIVGNTGTGGTGGIHNNCNLNIIQIANSIVVENKNIVLGEDKSCGGAGFSPIGQNIGGKGCFGFSISNIPLLSLLVDNGGSTKTHALLIDLAKPGGYNPAIDTADPAQTPSTSDQRGLQRDAKPDIGAFEYQGKCSDSYVQKVLNEECDDGNLNDKDGCSSMCTKEPLLSVKSGMGFDWTVVGSIDTQLLTVKNVGLGVLSFLAYTQNASVFSVDETTQSCSLLPGESCNILVKFSPNEIGYITDILSIDSNDPNYPDGFLVNINGTGMESAVQVAPQSVTYVDAFKNKSYASMIMANNLGNIPFKMGGADPSCMTVSNDNGEKGDFKLEQDECLLDELSQIQPGSHCKYILTFTPTKYYDNVSAQLTICAEEQLMPPKLTKIEIPLTLNVARPKIVVDPASIDFEKVILKYPLAVSKVTVKNEGKADLNIESCSLTNGLFQFVNPCPLVIASGSLATLEIGFLPAERKTYSDKLTITSDDPDNPSTSIDITGIGIAPKFGISSIGLQEIFNSVVKGTDKKALVINNSGNMPLNVSITPPQDDGKFVIDKDASTCQFGEIFDPKFTLAENEICSLGIQFIAPSDPGSWTDSISFIHDDPDGLGSISVTLTGTATPEPQPAIEAGKEVYIETVENEFVTMPIDIKNSGTAVLKLKNIIVSGQYFELGENKCVGDLAVDASCLFEVKFSPTTAGDNFAGKAVIISDNHPDFEITLVGKANVTSGYIAIEASQCKFEDVVLNSVKPCTVKISSTGSLPIQIIDVSLGKGQYYQLVGKQTCEGQTLEKYTGSCELGIDFNASDVGTLTDNLVVGWKDSKNIFVNGVTLENNVIDPKISVEPTDVSSKVKVGEKFVQPIIIKNTGKTELKVTNMALSGAGYSLIEKGEFGYCNSLQPKVASGDKCRIDVVITPSSAVSFKGTLKLTADVVGDVIVALNITGYTETAKDESEPKNPLTEPEDGSSSDDNEPSTKPTTGSDPTSSEKPEQPTGDDPASSEMSDGTEESPSGSPSGGCSLILIRR